MKSNSFGRGIFRIGALSWCQTVCWTWTWFSHGSHGRKKKKSQTKTPVVGIARPANRFRAFRVLNCFKQGYPAPPPSPQAIFSAQCRHPHIYSPHIYSAFPSPIPPTLFHFPPPPFPPSFLRLPWSLPPSSACLCLSRCLISNFKKIYLCMPWWLVENNWDGCLVCHKFYLFIYFWRANWANADFEEQLRWWTVQINCRHPMTTVGIRLHDFLSFALIEEQRRWWSVKNLFI